MSETLPTEDGRAQWGKIHRLPLKTREELHHRLQNGETTRDILSWLNSKMGPGDSPVNEMNLSRYRNGPYAKWLQQQERLQNIRELSRYAANLAQANGGSIAQGAVSIASGQILQLLEAVQDAGGQLDSENLFNLSKALNALRVTEQNNTKLQLDRQKISLAENELALNRQRFQRQSLELFLKWRANQRAVEIADGPSDLTDKIEQLGHLIFKEDWRPNTSQP